MWLQHTNCHPGTGENAVSIEQPPAFYSDSVKPTRRVGEPPERQALGMSMKDYQVNLDWEDLPTMGGTIP